MAMNISIHLARELADRARDPQRETERELLKLVETRIALSARQGGLCTYVEIPFMKFGLPVYNPAAMAARIAARLRSDGWTAKPTGHVVYVSWKKETPADKKRSRSSRE